MTEAVVLLEEVFADCSERTAFLASGDEIPRSNFIFCTLFSKIDLGHSREEAEWSPLQLTHFLIFAVGCLMARFPTMHTQSSALASSRAMAVLLAVEATQRGRNVWLHGDPQVTGCDVFCRLWRCKRQYYSISTTSAISVSHV